MATLNLCFKASKACGLLVRSGEGRVRGWKSLSEEKGEIKDTRVPWTEPGRASVLSGLRFDERKARINQKIYRKARFLIDERSLRKTVSRRGKLFKEPNACW